ncbi:hypothetical protein GGR54DRAFT_414851 [Hypoxylon sp. NC1633]|nr:hypothetical protein GGR54DRAFT_414851 [Hypoxylon sp. NC1633]
MSNITCESLPHNRSNWLAYAKECQISDPTNASIHDYDFLKLSASKVGDAQLALLRVLWKPRINPFDGKGVPNSNQIVSEEYLKAARSLLNAHQPWKEYLARIKNTPNERPIGPGAKALGNFALVLQSQQNTRSIASNTIDDNKVDVSPVLTRSRARALRLNPPSRPRTPTPVPSSQAELAKSMDELDLSPSRSSVDQRSPLAGEAAAREVKIKSEQEVVISLTLFERSVCNAFRDVEVVTWHPDQESFEAKTKTGEKTFTAIVDGVMRVEGSEFIPVFNETKRKFRYTKSDGADIKAQESCQMAAKISQDADTILEEVRQGNQEFKMIWLAQDKSEVYVMVGTYDENYVRYMSHRKAKFSLAEVKEFGPYPNEDSKYMGELGVVILGLALGETARKRATKK